MQGDQAIDPAASQLWHDRALHVQGCVLLKTLLYACLSTNCQQVNLAVSILHVGIIVLPHAGCFAGSDMVLSLLERQDSM